jgi:hypothetical protein
MLDRHHCKASLLVQLHIAASTDRSAVSVLQVMMLPLTVPLMLLHPILPLLQVFAAVLAGDPPLDRIPGPVPLRDLVTKLLQTDPAKRLGTRGGAPAVTAHPFFQGIASATPAPLLPPPGLPEIPDAAVATATAAAAAVRAGGAEGGGGAFRSVRPRADSTDEQQDAASLAAMFFSDPNAVSACKVHCSLRACAAAASVRAAPCCCVVVSLCSTAVPWADAQPRYSM